jgi:hypothetical protein
MVSLISVGYSERSTYLPPPIGFSSYAEIATEGGAGFVIFFFGAIGFSSKSLFDFFPPIGLSSKSTFFDFPLIGLSSKSTFLDFPPIGLSSMSTFFSTNKIKLTSSYRLIFITITLNLPLNPS